jgi:DNA-binding CsgD family transcriptional regulator
VVGRDASNREAAAALFLSQKTIEYHLSNIYRKTNIHSRAELANAVTYRNASGPRPARSSRCRSCRR